KQLNGHKNIVTYMDSSIATLRHGGFEVFILMEYCTGGHLVEFLNTRLTSRLTEPEILTIFSDICEAVAHMHYHSPPIIHRDIKVENVLISTSPSSSPSPFAPASLASVEGALPTYKLCDFGSATTRIVPSSAPMSAREILAMEEEIGRFTTLQYRAPEICDLYQKKGISEKIDIWALGILLFKLCFFTTPFEDSGKLAIINVRYTMPTYPAYSKSLLGLIGE
ncbi:kinase-like domain-containing protein, partial [Blyttiomyces helicus]